MAGEDAPRPRHRRTPDEELLRHVEARLFGRAPSLRGPEIADAARVPMATARQFWKAMGFQAVDDETLRFTEADLAALQGAAAMLGSGRPEELEVAFAMTRALARSADRLAVWQTQLLAEGIEAIWQEHPVDPADPAADPDRGPEERMVAEATALRLADMADDLEPMLVYVWRRHLASAIARMLADSRPEDNHDHSAPTRVVGFADLVSFTTLVRTLDQHQLARLVQRFEHLATDVVVTHGGRVIKTVGDEVLFLHQEAAPAAAIALDLIDAIEDEPTLPSVRIGLARGPVLSRLGDVFGTTVNRASRLTASTPAGVVHVDEAVTAALREVTGFVTAPLPARSLRGIGQVSPSQLARSGTARSARVP